MHMTSADLKPVRPFHPISPKNLDFEFQSWAADKTNIFLEIGCGAGLHPIQWTGLNPSKNLIAIERTKNKFEPFKQRILNHERKNLYPVKGEAMDWVPQNIKTSILDGVFFLYPNPYPKEKQSNKRWHRSPFFHLVLKCLKPGGTITCATNEKFFFEECRLYGLEFWQLEHAHEKEIQLGDLKPRTHFEKKYLEAGQTCYEIIFRKRD